MRARKRLCYGKEHNVMRGAGGLSVPVVMLEL